MRDFRSELVARSGAKRENGDLVNWRRLIRAGAAAIGMLLLICAAPAFADSFTYHANFENPSDPSLMLFGTTQRITTGSGRVLAGNASGQLTDISTSSVLGQGAAGSIIFANPVPTSFLDVIFSFYLGRFDTTVPDPYPFVGDGITLAVFGALDPPPWAPVGRCCSGLGYAYIVPDGVPAFSVEFDTYDNGVIDDVSQGGSGCADPSDPSNILPCPSDSRAPHVAINLGNRGIFSAFRDQSLVPVPNLRNQVHSAHVRFSQSLLSVALDERWLISDFAVPSQYVPQSAFVGITGSTGSYADYQIVDDVTLTNVPEPPSILLLVFGLVGMSFFRRTSWGARRCGNQPDVRQSPLG